jgi:hypothetical protein
MLRQNLKTLLHARSLLASIVKQLTKSSSFVVQYHTVLQWIQITFESLQYGTITHRYILPHAGVAIALRISGSD